MGIDIQWKCTLYKLALGILITDKTAFKGNHITKDDERFKSWEYITLFSHNDLKI